MNYSITLKKGEALLLWFYKNITSKFTNVYKLLSKWFPALNNYPLLKYSVIPFLIALFVAFRYTIKFVIDKLAVWFSGFAGETGYVISERTVVLSIAAVFIVARVIMMISKRKKS